ncbi:MAG: F0F1 ATP synthase subunit epsilon [Methylobacteriaceae bacterium]|nr:F0F1 ATP synthase subunit epsilon [Methylobacteriaceae bacterium]MBV9703740.1 F0F1 ATP synthase subunit epsilon [Methylobacteriaceae bacterium]
MPAFFFELVSPERLLFAGEVEDVVVPGTEGEFTVLKDHAPLMSTLRPGIVDIGETDAKRVRLFVRGGFADVSTKGLTILAEHAIPLEELDLDKITAEIKDAEEDLADAEGDEPKRVAKEKLDHLNELKAALRM